GGSGGVERAAAGRLLGAAEGGGEGAGEGDGGGVDGADCTRRCGRAGGGELPTPRVAAPHAASGLRHPKACNRGQERVHVQGYRSCALARPWRDRCSSIMRRKSSASAVGRCTTGFAY